LLSRPSSARVGDQEAVAEHPALALQAEQRARRRTRAVAGGQVGGVDPVAALGRVDAQAHTVGERLDRGHGVVPADLEVRQFGRTHREVGLGVVLLQVDEGRALVAGLGQQVELVELRIAEEHPAGVPAHALGAHRIAHAKPVPDLERALGEADRARAGRQAVVVVEQQHTLAALREIDRQAQAHRPGADHHDRMAHWRCGVLVGTAAVGELVALDRGAVAGVAQPRLRRHRSRPAPQLSSVSHIWRSRSAVQTRGSRYWVASSKARVTSKGMQWSKMTQLPYFGFSAA
jgi:hypothetical protein